MEGFLNAVEKVNDAVNGVVWGWPALILLAFVGVLMTVLTKFFQISHIGHWLKNTIGVTFGQIGTGFVAIALLLFAFSTVLGWSHYGTKAFEYLFGTKSTIVYKVIFVLAVFGGAVMGENLAWDLSDTFNGLMMIPNLIGVLVLSPLVYKCTKNYCDRHLYHKDIDPMLSVYPDIQSQHADEVKKGTK